MMQRVMLKHTESSGGILTLGHPNGPTGHQGQSFVIEINGVPEGVSPQKVLSTMQQRESFEWEEVQNKPPGTIIREGISG